MILLQLIPYLLLLLIVWAICKYSKCSKKQKANIVIFILAVFVGCRYGVGWDYWNYTRAINEGYYALSRFEWIPRQIAYFAYRINFPQFYFIVTGFCSMFLIVRGLDRLTTDLPLSIYIFITFPLFFLNSLIIDRYFLSLSLILYSSTYLFKERKVLPFLIGVVIAVNIHVSSIISILFLIPYYFKINVKINIIFFVLTFLISSSMSDVLLSYAPLMSYSASDSMTDKVSSLVKYAEKGNSSDMTKIPILFYTMNVVNLLFRKKLFISNEKVDIYLTTFNIGCCIMQLFSFEQSMSARFSAIFLLYLTLIVPFYKHKAVSSAFYILGLLLFVYALSINGSHPDFYGRRNCYLPYDTFFRNLN